MAKKTTPLIYLDTSVLLDLITGEPQLVPEAATPRGVAAQHVIRGIEERKARFATSALVELEVFGAPRVRKDPDQVAKVTEALAGLFADPDTVWSDIDRLVAAQARELFSEIGPKYGKNPAGAADIGHLAAAVRLGCTHFMATDQGFPINSTLRGTRIMFPAPLWDDELW